MAAWAVFIALNPFMTAQPGGALPPQIQTVAALSRWQRLGFLVKHRARVSADQQVMFPHNALHGLGGRAAVVLVQGFGRFGPLGPRQSDSTRRYDRAQDAGVLLWLPWVISGALAAIRLGKQQAALGQVPAAWALVVWEALAVAVVTAYLPMAWDRYLLPIQAPAALLAALPMSIAAEALLLRLRRPRSFPRPG